MSAFVVSDKHINSILSYANRDSYSGLIRDQNDETYSFKCTEDLNKLAQVLLDQNIRSVNYRYDEDEKSPEIKFKFEPNPFGKPLSPVQILKACSCYDYQACETEDYNETFAYKIIDHIRHMAIRNLPGYEDAEWEIS
jgi:hypothetical protein